MNRKVSLLLILFVLGLLVGCNSVINDTPSKVTDTNEENTYEQLRESALLKLETGDYVEASYLYINIDESNEDKIKIDKIKDLMRTAESNTMYAITCMRQTIELLEDLDSTRDWGLYHDKLYEFTIPSRSPEIGMTAQEVIKSKWGRPEKVNKTTTKYGVREQWVYSAYRYVYLEDGIVTTIQE